MEHDAVAQAQAEAACRILSAFAEEGSAEPGAHALDALQDAVLEEGSGLAAAVVLDDLSMGAVTRSGQTGKPGWLRIALWLSDCAWNYLPDSDKQDLQTVKVAIILLHRATNADFHAGGSGQLQANS